MEARAAHMTPDEFRAHAHAMVEWIARYMERVGEMPVRSGVAPGEIEAALPREAPERGEAWDAIVADIDRIVVPGLTHWQSPRFFAYFPCNASGPGILGEMLSAGLNVNGMLWATSPAAAEIETRMLEWMRRAFALPDAFAMEAGGGGVIQGTASEAALVALVAARARAAAGDRAALYASTQAHSSIVKAAMIAGLARDASDTSRVRLIGTNAGLSMDVRALRAALASDRAAGLVPTLIVATHGTTATLALDPIDEVVRARDEGAPDAWVHVDAAHAGCAWVCPEFRAPGLNAGGAEGKGGGRGVDSVCVNPHKWLLTNFDCDLFWVRDREALTNALSINPEYLRTGEKPHPSRADYRDWQVALGRRFRALKLWFVVRHYGLEGLRAHVRGHVELARRFAEMVRGDDRFDVASSRLNLVCFRLRAGDDETRALMERANASGRVLLSHAIVEHEGRARFVIRAAIGATSTTATDVDTLADALGVAS